MSGGFPEEALVFYEGLEADNTKAYWTDHKAVYERAVREPLDALLAELAPEFGTAKVFRPYRDVRFSKDKTPYKTAAAAVVEGTVRCTCSSVRTGCTSAAATGTPRPTRCSGCGPPSTTTGRAGRCRRCSTGWPGGR
jgi:uncharacterized protein (DUF2461 family)